jgi:P-type conjugative transfer ATPase TrbB
MDAADEIAPDRAPAFLKRVLGRAILDALADPLTIEILLNPDGRLWHERLGAQMTCIGSLDAAAAGSVKAELTRTNPLLECELLLDGSRVAAQVPPVVRAPTLSIRKHASSIFTFSQYLQSDAMTLSQADVLRAAIANHRNILVVGGTRSGKTTLMNAIIHAMVEHDPHERFVILEDTIELQCAAEQDVRFKKSPGATMTDLLRTSLRMRPDRLLVGEVRGPEALDLLMAWNSGHEGGCASLHANGCRPGLSKLAMLVSMAPEAPRHIEPLIGEVVHVLVHIARTPRGGRIQEIREVRGFHDNQYQTVRSDTSP